MANPAWQPNILVTQYVTVIVDPNGNIQQCIQGGLTGLQAPDFADLNLLDQTPDNGAAWQLVAILAAAALPSSPMPALPPPTFVNDADGLDPNLIVADMVASFEAILGRQLYPAQVERIEIDLWAYRESLVRNQIQYAGEQCLVAFAAFPMLDYLGQLLSVTRLAAQGAVTNIQFTLAAALTVPITIPAGTQIGSVDGAVVFATVADLVIAAGSTTGNVNAAAIVPGTAANGYLAGQISVLLNPNALISAVTNSSTTSGGSDPETDDHLRTRIQAAPNEFSTAGPAAAYRFWALSADPSIIDALVTSPVPGTVDVYVLTGPITVQPVAAPNSAGIAGSALLGKVAGVLSGDAVRPLTDTVNVLAVTEVDYQIVATVTLFSDADPVEVQAAVNAAAAQYAINQAGRIQRDIVPSEIIAALSVPGVYEVALSSPAYTQLTAGQWANCTAITLTFATSTEHS